MCECEYKNANQHYGKSQSDREHYFRKIFTTNLSTIVPCIAQNVKMFAQDDALYRIATISIH